MQIKEFKLRRSKLFKAVGEDSATVVFSAKNYGGSYPYHQNSDFYYLTGFTEPESIAVLAPRYNKEKFILFNRKNDSKKEVWEGPYAGQRGARNYFGADQSFAISEADKILPNLLANYKNVYSNVDLEKNYNPKIITWLKQSRSKYKNPRLMDIGNVLHKIRLRKSCYELTAIRKAIDITAMGILRTIKKCAPDKHEFELEAEILHEFMRLGGYRPAFPTIVASGINACTLHYSKNSAKLNSGELVLIDAGARYEHYCADVSRTFPISGKFSRQQRIIYEIVLSSQMEVIKKIQPGVTFRCLQSIAERAITTGLIEAKLLHGKTDLLLKGKKFMPFFMHKIGHWLGLDPHDVGNCSVFEPGMVLTIEPGIYIKDLKMGIRLEDNVLITKNGCEILTSEIPKNVSEIEKIMNANYLYKMKF